METAYSVTVSCSMGNPTGPKMQGLPKIYPLSRCVFIYKKGLFMEQQPSSKFENLNQDFLITDEDNVKNVQNSVNEKNEEVAIEKKKKILRVKKHKHSMRWPLIVLVMTFMLSFTFGFGSQFLLSGTGIAISIILLIFFLALATITDMIGVAVTSAEIEPFNAMSAKKVKGAKESLTLIKHADKVSSIFCDIIGDICGILSGSIGAVFTLHIVGNAITGIYSVLISSVVSALIAALTVFLKSLGKRIAMNNSTKIILILGKIINFFKFKKN